jgi:hypothetical protein
MRSKLVRVEHAGVPAAQQHAVDIEKQDRRVARALWQNLRRVRNAAAAA